MPTRQVRRRIAPWMAACSIALLFGAASLHAQNVSVAGIDSIQIAGFVQPRFDTSSVDTVAGTAWELRRARVGLRMYAAGWISGVVEGDFGRRSARMTDGYVALAFDPRFTVRMGQFKKPFDTLQLTSSREGPPVERDGLPRGAVVPTPARLASIFGYSDRDIGAEAQMRAGRVTLYGGFWNGSGANAAEADDGKQVGARAQVMLPGGWRGIGSWAAVRRSADEEDPDSEGRWSNAFEIAAATGRYNEPGFKALIQAMFGDGAPRASDGEEASFRTLQVMLVHHVAVHTVPYLVGVEPIARWGWADPDDDVDDDEGTLWNGGVNLYHHPRVKTQAQVDHVRPAEGDGATAFRIQTTLAF